MYALLKISAVLKAAWGDGSIIAPNRNRSKAFDGREVSNFEEILCNMSLSRRDTASGRCERSEESPDKLRHNAQFVGDSSLPAVVQNDMIILVLDTCNAGNRLWIRTSQRNATCS